MKSRAKKYRILFNHDGFCVFSNASRYQDINKPVGLAQVNGYVDEVAEAGCDLFLLSPSMDQLPGWDSDHYPYWRNRGKTGVYPSNTMFGKTFSRFRDFILGGNDLIELSLKRAREKSIDFFLSWRMNECHGLDDPSCPGLSDFYLSHPEYRIGDGNYYCQKLALSFAHPEVRDYQFGFIRELCGRYDIDGLELDFLRWPYYFPYSMNLAEKTAIMTDYVVRVRSLLNSKGRRLPLCVRIFGRNNLNLIAGLDVVEWVKRGLIDMINASPFYISSSEMDIEWYRKAFPDLPLYAELTQSSDIERHLELGCELSRKMTTELIRSAAYSYLDRGADGISLFNFVYYREYTFGNPSKLDKCEPNFAALRDLTDKKKLAKEPKHYFVGRCDYVGRTLPAQLVQLKLGGPLDIRIHIADDLASQTVREQFKSAILRVQASVPWERRWVTACANDKAVLSEMTHESELFPQPYREGIPETSAVCRDFAVPVESLHKGWNSFSLIMINGEPIEVKRAELALYPA